MSALRAREWVALILLALSAFIAFTFLNADARGDLSPRTPIIGQPLDTPTPAPSPTNTVPPPATIEPPEDSWLLSFYNRDEQQPSATTAVEALDIEYESAPFGDFADDDWRLEATTSLPLEPGPQTFTLIHDGSVRVLVDGQEVASDNDPSEGPAQLVVIFQHDGGRATITIEARDTGGPFLLRWK